MQSFNSSVQRTSVPQGSSMTLNGPDNSFYSAGEMAAIMLPLFMIHSQCVVLGGDESPSSRPPIQPPAIPQTQLISQALGWALTQQGS